MRNSAWAITGVLVALALLSSWFFGLDGRHAVILVAAAFAAGIANGLLEAVDLPRPVPPALKETARGLDDLQALEFSLSSAEPGARAALEMHAVAASVAAARPDVPRSAALDAFLAQPRSTALTHREIRALLGELEDIALRATDAPARRSPLPHATHHQETTP